MDNISELPDDLLLIILSHNTTKDAVATSLLSKRWRYLWTFVPGRKYDDSNHNGDYKLFRQFVYRSFLSNKAPIREHLHLSLGPECPFVDIGSWINLAVCRHVRELHIDIRSSNNGPVTLPSSLYTSQTLQRLTLINCVSLNVRVKVCLTALKTLSLESVTYAHKTSLQRLLSGCPNLEGLSVKHGFGDSPNTKTRGRYVLDVPSLKYLDISDAARCNFRQIENMPELVTARVSFGAASTHEFLKAFTSVRCLTLQQPLTEVVNPCGMIFNQLVHLDWRTFTLAWWDLLTCMLQYSPKLRFLKLIDKRDIGIFSNHGIKMPTGWKPPSSVPECLLNSLEAFEWFGYRGRQRDRKMAKYVLKNATCLKTATFSPKPTHLWKKKGMLKELASVATASASAQILFD